jgi:hypothetical protein
MVYSDANASCGEDGEDGGGSHWSCVIYVLRSSARRGGVVSSGCPLSMDALLKRDSPACTVRERCIGLAKLKRRNIALRLFSVHGDAIYRTPLVTKFSILIRPSIANLFSWSLG